MLLIYLILNIFSKVANICSWSTPLGFDNTVKSKPVLRVIDLLLLLNHH
jgi:hypothetical protein